jgi:hypothetical protein
VATEGNVDRCGRLDPDGERWLSPHRTEIVKGSRSGVVDACRRWPMRNHTVRLAKLGWRFVEQRLKRACERFMRFVSGIERYLEDRLTRKAKALRGALEPQPADVLFDAFADHAAEDTVEVVRRAVRDPGQLVEREVLVRWVWT